MGRAARDSRLETRTARAELRSQPEEPYWRQLGEQVALGYRKGPRRHSWVLRWREAGRYRKTVLGTADDHLEADGQRVLTYFQASEKARAFIKEQAQREHGAGKFSITVNEVLDAYLEWFAAHRRSESRTRQAIDAHLRPVLGSRRVADLTPRQLSAWLTSLAKTSARRRRRVNAPAPALTPAELDPEQERKRKVSANRVLNILKAALNHAWWQQLVDSHHTPWRLVKRFPHVEQPRIRFLSPGECARFLKACAPDFRPLAAAALLTGCRLGEIAAMRVGDFNPEAGTVQVVKTKAGAPRHVPLTAEGIELFSQLAVDRPSAALLFVRGDGVPWGQNVHQRPMLEACARAKIAPPISFHILRHTYASLLIKGRVPLSAVADLLGHADTRITKRHYAHLAPGFLAREVRRALPTYGVGK